MEIDVVIIGLNAQATLRQCIQSVCQFPYCHIYYVDGGSTDESISIAQGYPHVHVIPLDEKNPSPGLGRNKGWKSGSSPLVQFLDSDTILDSRWFDKALTPISYKNVAAIRGFNKELYPDHSIYNWIGDQEWNSTPGETETFGGNVLIRRDVLEQLGGYNEELVAGEDPELSLRVRMKGFKIFQLPVAMTYHDLAMTTIKQYLRRAYRSGYAYAAVYELHSHESSFWRSEVWRLCIRGGGSLFFFWMALVLNWGYIIPALFLLLYPRLFKVKALAQQKNLSGKNANIYAWHCSLVIIPQFLGLLRYYVGKIFGKPLRNRIDRIATRSSN